MLAMDAAQVFADLRLTAAKLGGQELIDFPPSKRPG
jgi:hypothetical protein